MNTTPAQQAIANLIELAEKGEIDPWDVPVIQIIDRFLAELGLMDEETPEIQQQQTDLPKSGQAFLWASMLVLLKADSLHLLQEELNEVEAEEFLETELLEVEIPEKRSLTANLEQHIRRRTSIQPPGKRRVTLQELIEQLEYIAAEIEAVNSDSRPRRSQRSRSAAIKAIAQLAHNENLTELAAQLEHFLYSSIPQLTPERDYVDWEQLLQWWQNSDVSGKNEPTDSNYVDSQALHSENQHKLDKAGVFWALLLLSAQSKVELSQQEFYQDLTIKPLMWCN
jgi:segregation and condensation protein A